MTERQWLTHSYPLVLLDGLRRASGRKLRLLGCACCYQIWALFADERSRQAVSIAEQYAERLVDEYRLKEVFVNAQDAIPVGRGAKLSDFYIPHAAAYVAHPDDWNSAHFAVESVAIAKDNDKSHRQLQLRILHDIFSNPFQPVILDPEWQTSTVLALAQAAYDDRTLPPGTLDPARLGILADALEEAGCTNSAILNHLRQPGSHVRGCWAVDLLSGKR